VASRSGIGPLPGPEKNVRWRRGSMVICHAQIGFPGCLPRWRVHLARHVGENGKSVGGRRIACSGKYVGALLTLATGGVATVRVAIN